jgi:hypothetical protein
MLEFLNSPAAAAAGNIVQLNPGLLLRQQHYTTELHNCCGLAYMPSTVRWGDGSWQL